MVDLTKTAEDVFAPTDIGGQPRGADMGEAQTWGTEIEEAVSDVDSRLTAVEGINDGGDGVSRATWATLSPVAVTREGQTAFVPGPDPGTHTDPISGLTVPNEGTYTGYLSPNGWLRIGAAPANADNIPKVNLLPDPFGRLFPYFTQLSNGKPHYTGVPVASLGLYGFDGNYLLALTTDLAQRYYLLADTVLKVGDKINMLVRTACVAANHTLSLIFLNSSLSQIGGAVTASPGSGTVDKTLSATIPSGTVYILVRLGGGTSGSKAIVAVAASYNSSVPGFVDAPAPADPSDAENLWPDPFWRLLDLGVPAVDGYSLLGSNVAAAELVTVPAHSPFSTKAIFLPNGSAVWDAPLVDVARLGLKVGETLHITAGMVANQTADVSVYLEDASTASIASDTRSAAINGHGEINLFIPITQDCVDDVDHMRIRFFSANPVNPYAYITGIYVGKKKRPLVNDSDIRFQVERKVNRPLAGKTMLALGCDSLWGDQAAENDLGIMIRDGAGVNFIRCGFGGTVMSTHADSDFDKFSGSVLAAAFVAQDWTDQIAAAANILSLYDVDYGPALERLMDVDPEDVAYILTNQCTNEFGQSIAGGLGFDDSTDRANYNGGLNVFFSTIKAAFSHIQFFVLTPNYRTSIPPNGEDVGNSDTDKNEVGLYFPDYVDTQKRAAARHRAFLIDLDNLMQIDEYNAGDLTDGNHPTYSYDRMGEVIVGAINARGSGSQVQSYQRRRPFSPVFKAASTNFTAVTLSAAAVLGSWFLRNPDGIIYFGVFLSTDGYTGSPDGILQIWFPPGCDAAVDTTVAVGRVSGWASGKAPCAARVKAGTGAGSYIQLMYSNSVGGPTSFLDHTALGGNSADKNYVHVSGSFLAR